MSIKLIDEAEVIRSKNSGPFELTFDIIFREWAVYELVCSRKAFTKSMVAALYKIPENDVLNIVYFAPAKAVKVTIKRPFPSGSPGETDVYGAQQHAPFIDIELELD